MRAAALLIVVAACGKSPSKSEPSPAPAPIHDAAARAVAAEVDAAPSAPPPPTFAETRTYRDALRAGRKAARRKRYRDALAHFETALAAIPGDARALSEVSWVAFKAGELDKAEVAARKSVIGTGDVNLKAASLYNLGRVEEARGDRDAAIATYLRSYRLRPHATVARRLDALGVAIPPDRREHAAELAGPYPDLDAACASFAASRAHEDSCYLVNTDRDVHGPKAPAALSPPWLEAGLFLADGSEEECRLAVRTAAGWFVGEPLFDCVEERVDVTIDRFEAADLVPASKGAELVLGYTVDAFVAGDDDAGAWGAGFASDRALVVCGGSPPRCAGPFDLGYADDWTMQFDPAGASVDGAKPVTSHFRFEYRFDDRGVLHVTQGARAFATHPMARAKQLYDQRKGAMGSFAIDLTGSSTSGSPSGSTPAP